MKRLLRGDALDRAFFVGITLKGLDGVLEVIGGLLLLALSPATIDRVARALKCAPLLETGGDISSVTRPEAVPEVPAVTDRAKVSCVVAIRLAPPQE